MLASCSVPPSDELGPRCASVSISAIQVRVHRHAAAPPGRPAESPSAPAELGIG